VGLPRFTATEPPTGRVVPALLVSVPSSRVDGDLEGGVLNLDPPFGILGRVDRVVGPRRGTGES